MANQPSSNANEGSPFGGRFASKQQGNNNTGQTVGSANNSTVIGSIAVDYGSKPGRLWTEILTMIGKHILLQIEVDEVFKRLEGILRERLPVLATDEGHLPVKDVQVIAHMEGSRAAFLLFYDVDHPDVHLHVQSLGSVPVVMHVDNTTIHPSITYSFYAQEGVHVTHEPILHLDNGSSSELHGPEAWSVDAWRRGDTIRPVNTYPLHNDTGHHAHQQFHYATSAAVAVDPGLLAWDDEFMRTFLNDPSGFATQVDDWLDDAVDAADSANANGLHPHPWPGLSLEWHHGPEITKTYLYGTHAGHTDPTIGHDPHGGHTDPTIGHELLLNLDEPINPTDLDTSTNTDELPEHLL